MSAVLRRQSLVPRAAAGASVASNSGQEMESDAVSLLNRATRYCLRGLERFRTISAWAERDDIEQPLSCPRCHRRTRVDFSPARLRFADQHADAHRLIQQQHICIEKRDRLTESFHSESVASFGATQRCAGAQKKGKHIGEFGVGETAASDDPTKRYHWRRSCQDHAIIHSSGSFRGMRVFHGTRIRPAPRH